MISSGLGVVAVVPSSARRVAYEHAWLRITIEDAGDDCRCLAVWEVIGVEGGVHGPP